MGGLLKAAQDSAVGETRICDLSITSLTFYHQATEPPSTQLTDKSGLGRRTSGTDIKHHSPI